MNLIDAFVDRSRVTILTLVLIIVCGYLCYVNISKESTPDVKIPIIYTIVTLEGISPQDAERLLLKPIESKLKAIDGIKEMVSYANEGSAVVLIEFHAGFNNEKALNDVRNKVQDAEYLLPREADKPTVHEVNLSLFPVLNVILTGDVPKRALINEARTLQTKLEQVKGVLEVNIGGDMIDSLEILIRPEMLEAYKLSIEELQNIINSNNTLVAAGAMRSASGEFTIKLPSLIEDYESLMQFPIKVSGNAVVKIGDIAQVRRTFKDPLDVARVNGKPAVVLEISKRTGENIINTIAGVKDVVEEERKFWPSNIQIMYLGDESKHIEEMIVDLENNILVAILLVVIVVIASVGFRSALLISLSIPASFLAGVLFLWLFGYTLNVIVLFSLILTVGMIVDDAIVVSEYADRIMHEGVPVNQAFKVSAKRMLWPIFSATLVKIVVFLPLLFWPGVVGQFMRYMPITVVMILLNSLLFALFFQPALGPLFGAPLIKIQHETLENLNKFTHTYYVLLEKVLNRPKTFVASIMGTLVLVYAFFISFGTGVEFFPKIEPESANIILISPGNLSLNERDSIMMEVEKRILDMKNEIKIFYAKAGIFDTDTSVPEDTIGSILIEYENWEKRRKSKFILEEIFKRLSDLRGIIVEIRENKPGPPPEKPIRIDIAFRDFEKVKKVADVLLKKMYTIKGLIQVEDSRPKGAIEWHLIVDRQKAAQYKVDIASIGATIRLLSNGMKVSTYRPDDVEEEVDILLRAPAEYRSLQMLDRLKVVNLEGDAIPLSNFVTRVPYTKVSKIKKSNREKVVTIKADVEYGVLVDDKIKEIKSWVKEQNLDSIVDIMFKGEEEDQQETGGFLMKAFLLTLIMMFMIILTQFNNYYHAMIVMSAVFLSTVGVLLGLIVTWQPFGIVMCGIGIIALGGVVLNNNILFIDTYQHLRASNIEVKEAIIKTGIQRLRPILLTAFTAVLGLLPMVFGLTIDLFELKITYDAPSSQWWRQLSAAIAGGLTFATILTLFFTPCLLLIGKRFDRKFE